MDLRRREPRSEGADLTADAPDATAEAEHPDDYVDARELATTCAEYGEIDRGGWCRTHYWTD
jgi:hypothetical protein